MLVHNGMIHMDGQALRTIIIDYSQNPDPKGIKMDIGHEIHGPALVSSIDLGSFDPVGGRDSPPEVLASQGKAFLASSFTKCIYF